MINAAVVPGNVVIPQNRGVRLWEEDPTNATWNSLKEENWITCEMLVISFKRSSSWAFVLVKGRFGYVNAHAVEAFKLVPVEEEEASEA